LGSDMEDVILFVLYINQDCSCTTFIPTYIVVILRSPLMCYAILRILEHVENASMHKSSTQAKQCWNDSGSSKIFRTLNGQQQKHEPG